MTDDINHLPAQTIKDIQVNHTYLIRFGGQETLFSIKVLLITDKAYHIKWGDENETWELKEVLHRNYSLVEDISDFVVENPKVQISNPEIKYVPCYVCKGFGNIPDSNSTAGTKLCPMCHGSKMVITEITSNQ